MLELEVGTGAGHDWTGSTTLLDSTLYWKENERFLIKLPRGKRNKGSLTICCAGRNKIFFIKLPRGKIKLNALTVRGTRKKNRDFL